MDYSTINAHEIEKLPIYTLRQGYNLGNPGMGCASDAPGYPSYFIRPVYTSRGNAPSKGPQVVINWTDGTLRVIETAEDRTWLAENQAKKEALLTALWNRSAVPMGCARFLLWEATCYGHWQHCYHDDSAEQDEDKTFIYPVPYYKLPNFVDKPQLSDDWREKQKAAIEQARREIIEQAAERATPWNHKAVWWIRRFYPEYQPNLPYIKAAAALQQADWWQTESERPSPDQCQDRRSHAGSIWTHRDSQYCRWCGRENGVITDGSEAILKRTLASIAEQRGTATPKMRRINQDETL